MRLFQEKFDVVLIILIRNCISRSISEWSLFSSIRFCTSSTDSFGKLVFLVLSSKTSYSSFITSPTLTSASNSLKIVNEKVTSIETHLRFKNESKTKLKET